MKTFEICKVDAPSQFEQPMADYLIEALGQKGFTFQIDEAHKEIGGECGNLIAYWEGTDSSIPPLFSQLIWILFGRQRIAACDQGRSYLFGWHNHPWRR